MKKSAQQKKTSAKNSVSKKSKSKEIPNYYNHEGKSVRIPKLVHGMHKDIIQMYFTLPVGFRKNLKQVITKPTDVLTFGPMKGKQFRALLNSNSDEMRDYYKNKIFGAAIKEEFAIKSAQFFMPQSINPLAGFQRQHVPQINFTEEVQ